MIWKVLTMTKMILLISLDSRCLYDMIPLTWHKDYHKMTQTQKLLQCRMFLLWLMTQKKINDHLLEHVCKSKFIFISLIIATQVNLNRKLILSVLRNTCGQSELTDEEACREVVDKPRLNVNIFQHFHSLLLWCFIFNFLFTFSKLLLMMLLL